MSRARARSGRATVGRRFTPRAILLALAAAVLLVPATAEAAKDVHIRGKAYSFNHADTPLAGATIRVREIPSRTAVTDANGNYDLKVPDDTSVTPYIDPPAGYNEIDLQTFHTRGVNLENANFQTPADPEYNGLSALLGVERGPDGRPTQCVVVTTVSARDVRGVPFKTFVERTPHGVAGATASSFPPLPGPTYFNDSVIPDPAQTASSIDGGIIWTAVPAGTYRFVAQHPGTNFASFLATCEPGRVVNANPPWGMYELSPGEEPLAASVVAASVGKVKSTRSKSRRPVVKAKVEAGERVQLKAVLRERGRRIAPKLTVDLGPGTHSIKLRSKRSIKPGSSGRLTVALKDAAGDAVKSSHRVKLRRR